MSKRYNSEIRQMKIINDEILRLSKTKNLFIDQTKDPAISKEKWFIKESEACKPMANSPFSQGSVKNPFPNSTERMEHKLAEKKYFTKLQKLEKERIKLLQVHEIEKQARVPNQAKGMAEDNTVKESMIATVISKRGNTSSEKIKPLMDFTNQVST